MQRTGIWKMELPIRVEPWSCSVCWRFFSLIT